MESRSCSASFSRNSWWQYSAFDGLAVSNGSRKPSCSLGATKLQFTAAGRGNHDPAGDHSSRFLNRRIIESNPAHILKTNCFDVPESEVGPLRIVIRPPAHANPTALLIDSARPGSAALVVSRDDIGGMQSELNELGRIVEIADRKIAGQLDTNKSASTSRKARAAFQDRRGPFGETAKSFRHRSGCRIADGQDRIDRPAI